MKSGAWRVSYSLGNNQRGIISLGSPFEKSVVIEFERLVKVLASSVRDGSRVSGRDWQRIENLPIALREKLINERLIEPTVDEKIPTLEVLLKQYGETRRGFCEETLLHDRRICNYLLEYFDNKRIDLITPAEAAGIRGYLQSERTKGRGKLNKSSTNRAITGFKTIFVFAVECGYLPFSPFAKVKGGATTNPERQFYVTKDMLMDAVRVCNHTELAAILVFARFAGLRIPCEIQEMKFSDFNVETNIFTVHQSGKTGMRRVPIFEELPLFLKKVQNMGNPDREYVFEKYRQCTNVGTVIKKRMSRSGLVPWEKFFVNLRSSCITDKERLGWTKSVMNAVFGNSEAVRLGHYVQPMPDLEYGNLGKTGKIAGLPIIGDGAIPAPIVDAAGKLMSDSSPDSSPFFREDLEIALWNAILEMPRNKRGCFEIFCYGVPTYPKLLAFEVLINKGEIYIVPEESTREQDPVFETKKAGSESISEPAFEESTGQYRT
jgi:integrase